MESEKSSQRPINPVLLGFGEAAGAEAWIAGAAAAAHVAATACRAGGRDLRIATRDGRPLSAAAMDDLRRACPGAAIAPAAPGDAPALRLSGRHLIDPEILVQFLHSSAGILVWQGETIASMPGGEGGEAMRAPPESVTPLSDPAGAARRVVRATAKSSDGLVSRSINRPISQALSMLLLRLPGIRPLHMTLATAATGAAMFLAFLFGGHKALIEGGLLFQAASVLDGVDGEIARASYRSSVPGAMLDTGVDMATNLLFYLGSTVCLTHLYGRQQAIAGGTAFVLAFTGLIIMAWLARQIGAPGSFNFLKAYYRERFGGTPGGQIIELFAVMTSRDFFAFGCAIAILTGFGRLVSFSLAFFAILWLSAILIAAPAILRRARGWSAAPSAA
jgi:phosphatidylglycerophosphate synthase